jgi:hypothetical protein
MCNNELEAVVGTDLHCKLRPRILMFHTCTKTFFVSHFTIISHRCFPQDIPVHVLVCYQITTLINIISKEIDRSHLLQLFLSQIKPWLQSQ